jgi:enoyl-CoA hydratase
MTDAEDALRYELDGNVAVVHFDDEKANVLTHAVLERFHELLTRAENDEARAVLIVGRPGRFSAGFDLAVMNAGPSQALDLLAAGANLAVRIYLFPVPVVLAATGHALAMGAILLMAADLRIGADGDFKVGLPEVAIGMPLPRFAVDLARDRLSKRHFVSATQLAAVTSPADAVDVGFLDRVVAPDAVEAEARAAAHELAERLHAAPFQLTRQNVRLETARRVEASLAADTSGPNAEAWGSSS